jgi:hypothetical protein
MARLKIKSFSIGNFVNKLPKDTFTIGEWAQWISENPQWLTVNTEEKHK